MLAGLVADGSLNAMLPKSRSLPSGLGMPTRRTGLGRYVPAINWCLMFGSAVTR